MKSMIIVCALFLTVSCIGAMELQVSQAHKERFLQHLTIATGSMSRLCSSGAIPADHPIKCSLDKLLSDLKENDNDIEKTIKTQGLQSRLAKYHEVVESNPVVVFAQQQVTTQSGDIEYAKTFLKRTRFILAGLELSKKQPTYQNQWIGDVSVKDRVNFVVVNGSYPSDEDAQKDYLATFIYQTLFVPQD
jgi:hypothetical protein